MKICMFGESYGLGPSGVGVHLYCLVEELRKLGHEVIVLTGASDELEQNADSSQVVRFGRIIKIPLNKTKNLISWDKKLGSKVKEFLSREKFDIIHLHPATTPFTYYVLKYSKAVNVVTIHTVHGTGLSNKIWWMWWKVIARSLAKKINVWIGVSKSAEETIHRYFPKQAVKIVPNGVDVNTFHPEVAPVEELKALNNKILFVGRLDKRKGLEYLIQAFHIVTKKITNANLIIIGDGPEKEFCRELAKNSPAIKFVGKVSPEMLPRYYASCDIYCSPATGGESFGIVLLEAMAVGRPVVASNIAGYDMVVSDGKDGLLVPPCQPEPLADALIALLNNPKKRLEMGRLGREKALTYSWTRIAERVADVYKRELGVSSL